MKNPIKSLDDLLTKGANTAVKVWNITTGKTKSDLALLLMSAGTSAHVTNLIINPGYMSLAAPASAISSAYFTQINKDIEKDELYYSDSQVKNGDLEDFKYGLKVLSLLIGGFSTYVLGNSLINSQEESQSDLLFSIGNALYGAGLFVMTADSLPPRKSILKKGLDKLNELISSYQRKPAYETVRD